MKIVVNDYAGHPFQWDLSRALDELGHEVLHVYCSTNVTPHADFDRGRGSAVVRGISVGRTFNKYRPLRRLRDELVYGLASSRTLGRRSDVVLASNVPIVSLAMMWAWAWATRTRRVLWLQDIQSGLAGHVDLPKGFGWLARTIRLLERWLVRASSHVVAISPEFEHEVREMGQDRVTLIRNWAPQLSAVATEDEPDFGREHALEDKFVFLYTGTLGAKHRSHLIVQLAETLRTSAGSRVVLVSEGAHAASVERTARERGLTNLIVTPFQPASRMREVIEGADVCVALLNQECGRYAVPSKVLSYMAVGRPVLAAVPSDNDLTTVLNESGAGIAFEEDVLFLKGAVELLDDRQRLEEMGAAGRQHAASHFDPATKVQQFLPLIGG